LGPKGKLFSTRGTKEIRTVLNGACVAPVSQVRESAMLLLAIWEIKRQQVRAACHAFWSWKMQTDGQADKYDKPCVRSLCALVSRTHNKERELSEKLFS
jgi:hypothetical protein